MNTKKCRVVLIIEEEGTGKALISLASVRDDSVGFPRPFQKTLTWALAVNGECPKTLIEKQPLSNNTSAVTGYVRNGEIFQSKFFERVWENFCSQKFSQFTSLLPLPLPLLLSLILSLLLREEALL